MSKIEKDVWLTSPITGKDQVLCEYDAKNGASIINILNST